MDTSWVDKFCLDMPFTTKDYQPVWDAQRYFVGGKMFMMRGKDVYKRQHKTRPNDKFHH